MPEQTRLRSRRARVGESAARAGARQILDLLASVLAETVPPARLDDPAGQRLLWILRRRRRRRENTSSV